jgi:RNase adaptor protein for sRNA GlmZ degradation
MPYETVPVRTVLDQGYFFCPYLPMELTTQMREALFKPREDRRSESVLV